MVSEVVDIRERIERVRAEMAGEVVSDNSNEILEQTNFSAENMQLVVKQMLSTGIEIDYQVGDKPFTSICDYMDSCHFSCNGKKSPIVNIDAHTYTDEYQLLL